MLFGKAIKESEEITDVDVIAYGNDDQLSDEQKEEIAAKEVEDAMRSISLEGVTYFDGGEEAQKNFVESAEVQALVESRKMSKKTFVRLNKNDDFTRRSHLASLILARNNNDPLFKKLALNRINERKIRNAIFKKYESKAKIVAKKSQAQHLKNMKKMPSLPKIHF